MINWKIIDSWINYSCLAFNWIIWQWYIKLTKKNSMNNAKNGGTKIIVSKTKTYRKSMLLWLFLYTTYSMFNDWLWWEVERALNIFGSFAGPEFKSRHGQNSNFSFLYWEKINFFPLPGEMSRVRSPWTKRPAAACHKWYVVLNPYAMDVRPNISVDGHR